MRRRHVEEAREQLLAPAIARIQATPPLNAARVLRMEALVIGVAQTQNQIAELAAASARAHAEHQETLGRVETVGETALIEQRGMAGIIATINTNVKGLVVTTGQILGITTRTHALVQTIHRRGVGAGVSQLILDEWLMFYLYFILHPLAPITTEVIMSVWQFALVINRSRFIMKDLREGNIVPFSIGDIPRIYFTSPWKAIALIYFFNQKYLSMRGTPEYSQLFTGGIDSFLGLLGSNFAEFFTKLSGSSVVSLAGYAMNGLSIGRDVILEGIHIFYSKYNDLMDIIHNVCPTFGSDKTVFFNCLATYAVSGITIVVRGVEHYLSAPGYLAQGAMYVDMETNVIYWTMSMIWKAIEIVFASLLKNIKEYFIAFACSVNIAATTWTPLIRPAEWFGIVCKDKVVGGGSEIINHLDSLLANGTFVLFTAYILQHTSNNKIRLNSELIKAQENIVTLLIKLESSKKIMGENVLMLENVKYDIENILNSEHTSVIKTLSKSVGHIKNRTVRKTKTRAKSI